MGSFPPSLGMYAPGLTDKRSAERMVSLIKAFLKVLKRNIPVALVWYQRGSVRKIGSQNLAKWMESLDQSLLHNAMESDLESLINGDEPLVIDNDEDEASDKLLVEQGDKLLATKLLHNEMTKADIPRLPFPLSLMNKKEKVRYVSHQIWEEHRAKQDTLHVRM